MSIRRSPARHGGWIVKVEKGRHPLTNKRWTGVISHDPDTGLPIRTKGRAQEIERAALVAHRTGGRAPSDEPLAAYLARWMTETEASREPSTQYGYANIAKRQIGPRLGAVPLARLDALTLQAFYRSLGERYASTTVRSCHAMLDAALRQAVLWRLIPYNPADAVKLPPPRPKPKAILDAAHTAAFLAGTVDHPHHALWRLLADSWCRIGEALALAWGDVDWDSGAVSIGKTLSRTRDGSWRIKPHPKTAAGIRTIHLAPETVAALRRHRAQQNARRLELGPFWEPGEMVFDNGGGALVDPGSGLVALRRECERLELPVVTYHGFRHGGATLAAAAGMPLKAISDRLGHSSIAISADLYAHPSADADRAVAAGMAAILEGSG